MPKNWCQICSGKGHLKRFIFTSADVSEGRVLRERPQELARPDDEGNEAARRTGQPDAVDHDTCRRECVLLEKPEPN